MPELILLGHDHEIPDSIELQTSRKYSIKNSQYSRLTVNEQLREAAIQNIFEAEYQGSPAPAYNCHGLTFASKRTGIYESGEIFRILRDEYVEIKSHRSVIVGDIVVYYDDEYQPTHSGMVVVAENKDLQQFPRFIILSKILKLREIVHLVTKSPYGNNFKFFRIQHEYKIVQ